jgi:hypothetical protein
MSTHKKNTVDINSMVTNEKREPLPDYLDETQLENQEILTIINDIQSSPPNVEKRKEVYTKKYAAFAERYPVLFDMACGIDFDYDKFNYMMRIRGQISNKRRTVESASAEIGRTFYNMYHDTKQD